MRCGYPNRRPDDQHNSSHQLCGNNRCYGAYFNYGGDKHLWDSCHRALMETLNMVASCSSVFDELTPEL
jgi:hypothetical protein